MFRVRGLRAWLTHSALPNCPPSRAPIRRACEFSRNPLTCSNGLELAHHVIRPNFRNLGQFVLALLVPGQNTFRQIGTSLAVSLVGMALEHDVAFQAAVFALRNGSEILVREYTFEDFGALVEMYKDFEPKRIAQGLPPPDTPRIAHWLDRLQHKSRAIVALDGRRIIGHVILCPISTIAVEYTIFVHQDYRCRGLGEEMTRLALDFAAKMGFTDVLLCTEVTNHPAMSLYRKLGFRITSVDGDECEMSISVLAPGEALRDAA